MPLLMSGSTIQRSTFRDATAGQSRNHADNFLIHKVQIIFINHNLTLMSFQ